MPTTKFVQLRNRIGLALFVGASVASVRPVFAQAVHPVAAPDAQAVRLDGPIHLDGKLDEAIWHTAPVATGFRQNQPNEGQPATQRTEVRFAFDNEAIYVGARMYDDSGAAGVRTRLVRRDADIASDYFQVIFDTYHDHIGRLFFLVNPSGVRQDANGLGGGSDPSWDPIWEVKTSIDSLGWTAEMRIPFDQLRYPNTSEEQTWGLQMWRGENRLNEISQWAFWGLQESGGPPRFGHLHGLVVSRAPSRGEVLPYVVGRSTNAPVTNPADPFQSAHETAGRAGGDARILLTSNLTLNATVNPDFGQVEVDPAVVNLSAFETSFQEKRPFFVEGAGYFGFGNLSCYFCSNVSSLSTFYSRRIGRSPSMTGNAFTVGDYADIPDNTTIVGAAKLTGRTRSGWSVGVLDAVTGRARATVLNRTDSSIDHVTVEPPANYFVGRVQRDYRGGATQIRAIATSVIRDLGSDPFLTARLNSHSELVGIGTDWYFGRRDYRLMAQFAGSQVTGDTADIRRIQNSSARYFNRPDRKNGSNGLLSDAYDPTLTSLRGLGAYVRFSRETGKLLWEVQTNIRTPGFENNDIAFLTRADYFYMGSNVLRQWTRPTNWYRSLVLIAGAQQQFNFDGDLTDRQTQLFASMQTRNYWNISSFWIHRFQLLDDRLSRGGPVLGRVPFNDGQLSISTDNRKKVVGNFFGEVGCNVEHYCSQNYGLSAQVKPRSNISVSVGPSLSRSVTGTQYVTAVTDPTATNFYGRRYVFADLTQHTLAMDTRVSMTFTTNLTLELYVQPLIASGSYTRFKEFAAPRSTQRLIYGTDIGTIRDSIYVSPTGDSTLFHLIDPDGDTTTANRITIANPNFVLRSLRGNAVLRWEYRPGSTIYFVWTRSGSSSLSRGTVNLGDDTSALLTAPSTNIFLVKVSYRLGL